MTYIEFFDRTAAENLCACLTNVPERVIFLGDNARLMHKHIANYKKIFQERGYEIEFVVKTISKSSLSNAIEVLTQIVETYDDCAFGITGGDELLLMALGCVYEKYRHRPIQIHRLNVRDTTIYDYDADGKTIYRETPTLSVLDNVRLYGGDVIFSGVDGENTYLWDMTPDFCDDIDAIWDVCRENTHWWNLRIGVLERAQRYGQISQDGLTTTVSWEDLDSYLKKHNIGRNAVRNFLHTLRGKKLLSGWTVDENTLCLTYKNMQVKRCLIKAGQALEMKTYSLLRKVEDKEGNRVYDDVVNGVVIDWDGLVREDDAPDTKNEIDVMMTHDITPVFVSCKNGYVDANELHKLNTVANRFGGKYAKKALIATAVDALGDGADYFRHRAASLNITLIENVQSMTDAQFSKKLRNLWCN